MVVGEKYQKQYQKFKSFFADYADKCDADLVIFNEPLDKGFYRPLLSQKLLVPSQLLNYEMGVFLDLDILISEDAPSIFDFLPDNKSFGAILDQRGSRKFNETWKHIPRILEETTADYFTERNFKDSEKLQGSINGGVFVFRPKDVANIFSEYYYSKHNQGGLNSFEETPMAYITQINDLFEPIDIKFNTQVLYELKGTESGKSVIYNELKIPNFVRKFYYKKTGYVFFPTLKYKKMIGEILKKSYFVHFAGNYPILKLRK